MAAIWEGMRRVLAVLSVALAAGCGGGDDTVAAAGPEGALLKADLAAFDAHGVWWNPAQPGTGFFFEAQGGTGIVTLYMYETNGRPVWYGAPGTFTAGAGNKYTFTGTLLRYQGGQPLSSPTQRTPTSTQVGPVTIVFDDEKAQVSLPGRSFSAEKYYKRLSTIGAPWHQPETGIYWNSNQSGRGWTVEIGNGSATVAMFHYADDGQPTWNLSTFSYPVENWLERSGDFLAYSGGQTLTGAYKAPAAPVAQGQLGLKAEETCKATLRLPGAGTVAVERFAFGSLPPGAECRRYPLIPYTPSPVVAAASYFNDVVLKLQTTLPSNLSLGVSQTLPPSFTFTASGNVAALNGRTVYVIVVDPHDFYSKTVPPSVRLIAEPQGAVVTLQPRPLRRIGKYQAELQFYACLDPACQTQFVGSPFRLPYKLEVH